MCGEEFFFVGFNIVVVVIVDEFVGLVYFVYDFVIGINIGGIVYVFELCFIVDVDVGGVYFDVKFVVNIVVEGFFYSFCWVGIGLCRIVFFDWCGCYFCGSNICLYLCNGVVCVSIIGGRSWVVFFFFF